MAIDIDTRPLVLSRHHLACGKVIEPSHDAFPVDVDPIWQSAPAGREIRGRVLDSALATSRNKLRRPVIGRKAAPVLPLRAMACFEGAIHAAALRGRNQIALRQTDQVIPRNRPWMRSMRANVVERGRVPGEPLSNRRVE